MVNISFAFIFRMFWSFIFKFELWNIFAKSSFMQNRQLVILFYIFSIQVLIQANEIVASANRIHLHSHNFTDPKPASLNNTNNENKISTKNDNNDFRHIESNFRNKLNDTAKENKVGQGLQYPNDQVASRSKLIIIRGFNLIFQLHLHPTLDNTEYIQNKKLRTNTYLYKKSQNNSTLNANHLAESCLYIGYVNEDKLSKAFMNLCNQGNIVNIDLASKFYFKQKKLAI